MGSIEEELVAAVNLPGWGGALCICDCQFRQHDEDGVCMNCDECTEFRLKPRTD